MSVPVEDDPLPDPLIQLKLYKSEDMQQVIVTLTGLRCQGRRRPGIDLVVAIDVSQSMSVEGDRKLEDVMTAMKSLLGTNRDRLLTEKDRLAIITFSKEAQRLSGSGLLIMNEKNKEDLQNKVRELNTEPSTNILGALEEARNLLQERELDKTGKYPADRPAAIFLLSDGKQKMPTDLPEYLSHHPIYTFGFGKDHDPKVLYDIAMASLGGTFNHVLPNNNHLTEEFSLALAPIRFSLIRDLKLEVQLQNEGGWRKQDLEVDPRVCYPHEVAKGGAITTKFGYLDCNKVRTVHVELGHPAADPYYPLIYVKYHYKSWVPPASTSHSFQLTCRTYGICVQTSTLPKMRDTDEIFRLKLVSDLIESIKTANEGKLKDAKTKMAAAMKYLLENKERIKDVAQLEVEGRELKRIMQLEPSYKKELPYALSVLSSYLRQRPPATNNLLSSIQMSPPGPSTSFRNRADKSTENRSPPSGSAKQ